MNEENLARRPASDCSLCDTPGGRVVWADADWRIVAVDDEDFPAFYRVIAREHIAEFSDLNAHEMARCMELVSRIDSVLRSELSPASINLAALGNMVPHLHWHVTARFHWDRTFPGSIWSPFVRERDEVAAARVRDRGGELESTLRGSLK